MCRGDIFQKKSTGGLTRPFCAARIETMDNACCTNSKTLLLAVLFLKKIEGKTTAKIKIKMQQRREKKFDVKMNHHATRRSSKTMRQTQNYL